jgi:hypothetical protein
MIIQLQFSEIMGCANLFQRFLTLAVYCVSTPSILLTRVHVTWLVLFNQILQWPYANYLVRISTAKRVLTGFSMKIKIKKNTERIKNIIECNIELEIYILEISG